MIDKNQLIIALHQSKQNGAWTAPLTKMMMELAQGVANHHIFRSYPYKSDLIQDGLVHLIETWTKYNVDKSDNPFGYFTHCLFRRYNKIMKKEFKKHIILSNYELKEEDWIVIND